MDKNKFLNKQSTNKSKLSFLKKDGFYLVLFLCVCMIVGVATYVNTRSSKKKTNVVVNQRKISLNNEKKKNKTNIKKNEVSKDDRKKTNMDNANLANKNNSSVAANANVATALSSPVKGTIAQAYTGTEGSMATGIDKVSRTILGEYIKVQNVGTPVYCSVNGTVCEVNGGKITILSKDNKLKVVYDNLDPASITLKNGNVVSQNSKIGLIGDSDNAKDRIVDCDHLYFEIDEKQKDGNYKDVNPQNYIKY
ncbi:MAG: M23 family metallopeptidase [Clostridium sp.]|nr:M23 family metallopeptidase [Clostridium sp.]